MSPVPMKFLALALALVLISQEVDEMKQVPRIIPSSMMTLNDVPVPESNWARIAAFALTLDPREIGKYGKQSNNPNLASASSTISELRSHLYVEQRRWNHFGIEPDEDTMCIIRKIIRFIRAKLDSRSSG